MKRVTLAIALLIGILTANQSQIYATVMCDATVSVESIQVDGITMEQIRWLDPFVWASAYVAVVDISGGFDFDYANNFSGPTNLLAVAQIPPIEWGISRVPGIETTIASAEAHCNMDASYVGLATGWSANWQWGAFQIDASLGTEITISWDVFGYLHGEADTNGYFAGWYDVGLDIHVMDLPPPPPDPDTPPGPPPGPPDPGIPVLSLLHSDYIEGSGVTATSSGTPPLVSDSFFHTDPDAIYYGRLYLSANTANINQPIPEPGTLLLLGTGLAGLAGYGKLRLKRKKRA